MYLLYIKLKGYKEVIEVYSSKNKAEISRQEWRNYITNNRTLYPIMPSFNILYTTALI
jgi:hypothetical protein